MIAFLSLASAAVAYGDRVGIYSLQADGDWAERRRRLLGEAAKGADGARVPVVPHVGVGAACPDTGSERVSSRWSASPGFEPHFGIRGSREALKARGESE